MIDTSFVSTLYDYEKIFDELLDDALNKLSPDEYDILLERIDSSLADHGHYDN